MRTACSVTHLPLAGAASNVNPVMELLAGRTAGLAFRRDTASFPASAQDLMVDSLSGVSLSKEARFAVALTFSGLLLLCRPIAQPGSGQHVTAVSIDTRSVRPEAHVHENVCDISKHQAMQLPARNLTCLTSGVTAGMTNSVQCCHMYTTRRQIFQ